MCEKKILSEKVSTSDKLDTFFQNTPAKSASEKTQCRTSMKRNLFPDFETQASVGQSNDYENIQRINTQNDVTSNHQSLLKDDQSVSSFNISVHQEKENLQKHNQPQTGVNQDQ